jgi:hypothetical protein
MAEVSGYEVGGAGLDCCEEDGAIFFGEGDACGEIVGGGFENLEARCEAGESAELGLLRSTGRTIAGPERGLRFKNFGGTLDSVR